MTSATAICKFRHAPSVASRPIARRTAQLLMIGLCLVLAACTGAKKKEAARPVHAALVQTATVAFGTMPLTITGTGTVTAWQEAPVGAEVGGLTAVGLFVDEGQTVKQGQPLLKMDDVLLQAQYRQARANADKSQKVYARSKELFDKGYLSQAALEAAEADAAVSQAALSTAQTNLSLATVRAPVSGVVVSRKAVLGQIVQSGAELFRIVRDGRIELNMEVPEVQLNMLKAGMPAMVYGEGGRSVAGTVRLVTPAVSSTTRLGMARISVPWASGFRPGMFARGEINVGEQNVLSMPQKAVVYHENLPGAFVVGEDSKARFSRIELGQAVGDNIIVKSGLKEGDNVITTGAGFLNDGDLVKTTKAAARLAQAEPVEAKPITMAQAEAAPAQPAKAAAQTPLAATGTGTKSASAASANSAAQPAVALVKSTTAAVHAATDAKAAAKPALAKPALASSASASTAATASGAATTVKPAAGGGA